MTRAFACACRAVTGTASGEPLSVTWCHCGDCRRESGAPAFVWVGWPDRKVDVSKGSLRTRSTRPGVTRDRCGTCGSTIAYRDAGLPDAVYIPAGAFDEPDAFVPTEHAFWPERVSWLPIADSLPRRDAVTQPRVASASSPGTSPNDA